ncbi:hypothetical protein AADZ86_10940 [Colwelliaceae bacterium BS250]
MQILLVADIFGQTSALKQLATSLPCNTIIVDPYQGQLLNFDNEQHAYQYFNQHIGLSSYSQILAKTIDSLNANTIIVAFSIGASATWLLSESMPSHINKVMAFYGSQIRHHISVLPQLPFALTLASSEPHYSVATLAKTLAVKNNVSVVIADHLHGFMNLHSVNFNQHAYNKYLQQIIAAISR